MLEDGHAVSRGGMRGDRSLDLAFAFGRATCNEGQVFFADLIVLELGGKVALGGDVFGEEEDAAGILVEPMDEPEAWIGRAGAGKTDLPGEHVENAVFLRPAQNGGKVGRFCDRYYLVVFVEDGQIGLSDGKSPVDDVLTQFYYENE
jgi:hypothetical protein